MKLIGWLTDEELNYLYLTYNYHNIWRVPEGMSRPWYFIPPEFVRKEIPCFGKYHSSVLKVVDKENPLGNWVAPNRIRKTLWEIAEIGPQEYFDILVLHINDTDLRPSCPNCGKELSWSGRILYGYGSQGHPWLESEMQFCSQSCSVNYRNNPESEGYNNYKKFRSEGGAFGYEHRHPEIYGSVGFCNWETHIETMRNKFTNAGNLEDECCFYITRAKGGLKFGISSNLDIRNWYGKCFSDYDIKETRVILKGRRDYIADFEANIKYELGTNIEYLDWKDVPKLIRVFGEVYKFMKTVTYPAI